MSENKQQPFKLDAVDIATILYHVHRGVKTEAVGFEDCERTIRQLTAELSPQKLRVQQGPLESGLWSCNLMDEAGQFWSPTGESFDAFINRVLRYAPHDAQPWAFDKFYNLLKKTK